VRKMGMKPMVLALFLLPVQVGAGYAGGITISEGPEPQHSIDTSFSACEWVTNPEWEECIKKHRSMWEDLLKENLDRLKSALPSEKVAELTATQESWRVFLEGDQKFVFSSPDPYRYMGREGYIAAQMHFMLKVRERALDLGEYADVFTKKFEE